MSAIDTLEKIISTQLCESSLKYCLVSKNKLPHRTDGKLARPNNVADFVDLYELSQSSCLENFEGIGISIQASGICAIDVDHCFARSNDLSSGDLRSKEILDKFKNKAYCEFSFSGTGLRILFYHSLIDNYSSSFYIKNEKTECEYYQCGNSYRYVTLTGNYISNNKITEIDNDTLFWFLNKYMKKSERKKYESVTKEKETRTLNEILISVKKLYLKNPKFQDMWFGVAPGSGKDESERDYKLLAFLYDTVTQDKEFLKKIFEFSPYFKTKDYKHIKKWEYNNNRYFNYVYERISEKDE